MNLCFTFLRVNYIMAHHHYQINICLLNKTRVTHVTSKLKVFTRRCFLMMMPPTPPQRAPCGKKVSSLKKLFDKKS